MLASSGGAGRWFSSVSRARGALKIRVVVMGDRSVVLEEREAILLAGYSCPPEAKNRELPRGWGKALGDENGKEGNGFGDLKKRK